MGRRQAELKGIERKAIKEINDAAEGYVDARDRRMKLTEKEHESKEALIAVMKKHDTLVYRDDEANPPLIVTLTPGKDNVKVAKAGDDMGEEAA